jgi:hypothetical protein
MDSFIEILSGNIIYSVTGGVIVLMLIVSLMSEEMRRSLKPALCILGILWGICVGYEVNTGNSIWYLVENFGEDSIESTSEIGAFENLRNKSVKELNDN